MTNPRTATSRPVFIVLGAVAASAVATSVVAGAAALLGVSTGFAPLQLPAYLAFSILGTLAAITGWVLVVRFVPRPARILRILVPTLVALSFIPDIALLVNPFIRGATPAGVAALMLMHPIVAGIAVVAGRRIAPARADATTAPAAA